MYNYVCILCIQCSFPYYRRKYTVVLFTWGFCARFCHKTAPDCADRFGKWEGTCIPGFTTHVYAVSNLLFCFSQLEVLFRWVFAVCSIIMLQRNVKNVQPDQLRDHPHGTQQMRWYFGITESLLHALWTRYVVVRILDVNEANTADTWVAPYQQTKGVMSPGQLSAVNSLRLFFCTSAASIQSLFFHLFFPYCIVQSGMGSISWFDEFSGCIIISAFFVFNAYFHTAGRNILWICSLGVLC